MTKTFEFFDREKSLILTQAEEKIIYLLCEDMKVTQISDRLGISRADVSNLLAHARRKNKVKTNFGLVMRYVLNEKRSII